MVIRLLRCDGTDHGLARKAPPCCQRHKEPTNQVHPSTLEPREGPPQYVGDISHNAATCLQ